MNDRIYSRAEFPVRRLNLDQCDLERAQTSFQEHLRNQSAQLAREFDLGDIEFAKPEIGADTIREKAAHLFHLFQFPPQPVLDLKLFTGFQLISLPYDVSWAVGTGLPLSALDGRSTVFNSDKFSASGFGIFLSSDRHVLASVMPQGQFTASWVNFDPPSPLRSFGGTGTVVYGDDDLLVSRQPTVWDVTSPDQFAGAKFDLPFADTATPPFPGSFGPIPLAPVLFEMLPEKQYLVWFYIWQINVATSGKAFIAVSQANIPLVSVSVGDPVILH